MSKKIHKDVRSMSNIVSDLGISKTDIIGMICSTNGSELSTVLASENGTRYNELAELLEGDSEQCVTLYKNKKGYVVPGSDISGDKLKITCKEHHITITTDLEKADLIISNDDSFNEVYDHEIPKHKIMFCIENGYGITEYDSDYSQFNKWMVTESIKHTLWDSKIQDSLNLSLYNCEYDSLPYNTYVYTGLALEILNKIVMENIPTIQGSRLVDESPNQVILTHELLDQIKAMNNGSGEDRILLKKILPTIKCDTNHHLLWDLCNTIDEYALGVNRDKDLKYWFTNKVKHSWYYNMTAEDFIKNHDENETLTPEGFKFAEPQCRKDIYISNRELYTFRVEIKPEYHKYLKNGNK